MVKIPNNINTVKHSTLSGSWASTSLLSLLSRKGRSTLWRRRMIKMVSSSFSSTCMNRVSVLGAEDSCLHVYLCSSLCHPISPFLLLCGKGNSGYSVCHITTFYLLASPLTIPAFHFPKATKWIKSIISISTVVFLLHLFPPLSFPASTQHSCPSHSPFSLPLTFH